MNASKYRHLDVEIIRVYNSGKSSDEIAKLFGMSHGGVDYRLKLNGIQKRSISEALVGQQKSVEHRKSLSVSRRISGVAKGSRNPNWKGGSTVAYERKVAALKRSYEYKTWRRAVLQVGYCAACGSTHDLQAHHNLPKAQFPHLVFVVTNGVCLCRRCHVKAHSKRSIRNWGELSGNSYRKVEDNPQPSPEMGRFNDYAPHSKEKI
jgi:5-methylcytosine-specific restriction endonuclease McrA